MRKLLCLLLCVLSFLLSSCAVQQTGPEQTSSKSVQALGLEPGVKDLVQALSGSIKRQDPGKTAVVGFEGPGQKITPLGEYLSDKISLHLHREPAFPEIMERKELDRVLQAHNLEYEVFFDQDTVQDFGQLLGADTLVLGTIQDLGSSLDVTIRAVSAASGRILGMGDARIRKGRSVQNLLDQRLRGSLIVRVNPGRSRGTVSACGREAPLRNGSCTFDDLPYGTCQVSVQVPGYETETRQLSLRSRSKTVTIELKEEKRYAVSFQVVPPEASLSCDGRSVELNKHGYAELKDLQPRQYSYLVRAEGYQNRMGRFNPSKRRIVQIELSTDDPFYKTKKAFFQKVRQSSSSQSFEIELWTNRKEYRLGQKIVFHFRAERDCYLNLVDINSQGEISLIFPNRFHQDNFVKGGRTYQIPGPDYGFSFQIEPPVGRERIYAVASTSPMDIFQNDFEQAAFTTLTRGGGSRSQARGIGVKMERTELDAAKELVIRVRR